MLRERGRPERDRAARTPGQAGWHARLGPAGVAGTRFAPAARHLPGSLKSSHWSADIVEKSLEIGARRV